MEVREPTAKMASLAKERRLANMEGIWKKKERPAATMVPKDESHLGTR